MTIFDLPYWAQCIILLVSQLLLIAFKTWNIQLISNVNERLIKIVASSLMIQLMWLLSSAVGVKSVIDGNYSLAMFYVLGGCIGAIIPLLKQNRRII